MNHKHGQPKCKYCSTHFEVGNQNTFLNTRTSLCAEREVCFLKTLTGGPSR